VRFDCTIIFVVVFILELDPRPGKFARGHSAPTRIPLHYL